jgi:hypothetical protein
VSQKSLMWKHEPKLVIRGPSQFQCNYENPLSPGNLVEVLYRKKAPLLLSCPSIGGSPRRRAGCWRPVQLPAPLSALEEGGNGFQKRHREPMRTAVNLAKLGNCYFKFLNYFTFRSCDCRYWNEGTNWVPASPESSGLLSSSVSFRSSS